MAEHAEGGRKRSFGAEGYDMEYKRRRFDEPLGGDGEPGAPPATLRILVRNQDAGAIIGRGGENIKRLRKTYDCHVVLPDSAGAPERVMTMMGRIESLVGALGDVLPTLGSAQQEEFQETREVQVLIPQPFMGTIIGTGGGKIKDLRKQTSCTIKIFSDAMPDSNERSIQLIGPVTQIKECVQNFLEDISKKTPREPIYLYEPGGGGEQFPMGEGREGFSPRGGGRGGMRSRGFSRGGRGNYRGGRGGGSFNGRGSDQSAGPRTFSGSQPPYQPPPQQQQQGGFTAPPPPPVGYATTGGSTAAPQPSNPHPPPTGTQYMPPPAVASPYSAPQPAPSSQPAPLMSQTQQVTIPCEYTEAILGKNGENLRHIKSQSSCEVVIADPKPGVNERVITITGSSDNIQYAQQLLQSSVRMHHNV